MKFYIISAVYNFSTWVQKNIQTLKSQTHENFECLLIDDFSTDDSVDSMRKAIAGDDRFKIICNSTRKYKARNVYEGIYQSGARDEDVIVMIDGDDWLIDEHVLQKLNTVYEQKKCWMTYGSYIQSSGGDLKVGRAYTESVIKNNVYRKKKWLASHLKTFKFGLFKRIHKNAFKITEDEYKRALIRALLKGKIRKWMHWRKIKLVDLLDESGEFIRRVDDKAFTFPMLEIAGHKARFIEEPMYV